MIGRNRGWRPTTRRPNNPLLNQIERHARRAENVRATKEVLALLVTVLVIFLFVWGIASLGHWPSSSAPSGAIVEDNRGPALKQLYKEALK